MNNVDTSVRATDVLEPTRHRRASTTRARASGATAGLRARTTVARRMLAAWVVLSALVFGISSPASSSSMTMEPGIVSVECSGSYGSIGRITGAGSSEDISFAASPAAQFLPARSSSTGSYTMIWKCDPSQAGTTWTVVATGATSGRTTTFTVIADAAPLPTLPAAGTNLLANGGIESGSTPPWAIIDQSGTTTMTSIATSMAQAGTRALLASSGTSAGGSVGQDVAAQISAGQTFTYSVWVRHPHVGGSPQAASIVLETIGGETESSVLAITVTDVWQRFDATLSLEAPGHSGLRAKVVMATPTSANRGTYLLDSASLVQSSPNPIGLLELVAGGVGSVRVKGYAIDPNQPYDAVPIVVSVGSEATQIKADVVRSDVAAMYPVAGPVHGFEAQLSTAASGVTLVCVTARNLGAGGDSPLGCVSVVIGTVTTTVPTTVVPTTAVPTTVATTAPPTTATPTTATPTTATPSTATPTTATTTTAPEPLGPQTLDPVALTSLFNAGDLISMTTAHDFQPGDADTLRLYWAFFNREPDIAGAKYWIGLSRTGLTLDDMAFNFARSDEFQRTYGSVTDHQFLEIVYRNVLGRRYDAAGYDYWLSMIDDGLLRSGAVRWIAANAEFVEAHPYP
ncbi:MAG: DUF4214 domain-containing protein [Acidimicrobiales bacterium]